jgi:hypothetical protein
LPWPLLIKTVRDQPRSGDNPEPHPVLEAD